MTRKMVIKKSNADKKVWTFLAITVIIILLIMFINSKITGKLAQSNSGIRNLQTFTPMQSKSPTPSPSKSPMPGPTPHNPLCCEIICSAGQNEIKTCIKPEGDNCGCEEGGEAICEAISDEYQCTEAQWVSGECDIYQFPPVCNRCFYDSIRESCSTCECPKQGQCCDRTRNSEDCSIENKCECHTSCSEDKDCFICTVRGEAEGAGADCQRAIAQVIMNRVGNPSYGSTVCDVVKQVNINDNPEFSPVRDCSNCDEIPQDIYCRCCRNMPLNEIEKSINAFICSIWTDIQNGKKPAEGLEATHFNNAGMDSWASRNCDKVPYDKCTVFDFFKCS